MSQSERSITSEGVGQLRRVSGWICLGVSAALLLMLWEVWSELSRRLLVDMLWMPHWRPFFVRGGLMAFWEFDVSCRMLVSGLLLALSS